MMSLCTRVLEIPKLLHEGSHVAEEALRNARRVRQEGASAVGAAREMLDMPEREVVKLRDGARLSSPRDGDSIPSFVEAIGLSRFLRRCCGVILHGVCYAQRAVALR